MPLSKQKTSGSMGFVLLISLLTLASGRGAYASLIEHDGWDGPGTGSANLTWYIASETSDLNSATQFNLTELALNQWAMWADITFTYGSAAGADRQFDFYLGGNTADANPQPPSSNWAWTWNPPGPILEPQAGNVYFDDTTAAPMWTDGLIPGTSSYVYDFGLNQYISHDIFFLLVHEIGHGLGLGHPLGDTLTNPVSFPTIMSSYDITSDGLHGWTTFYGLQTADIQALQSIYAARPASDIPTPSSLALLGLGLAAFRLGRCRKGKQGVTLLIPSPHEGGASLLASSHP